MIRIFGTGMAALLGLAFGSFLNVCLSRWPEGESVLKPRSHCRNCGRILAWWENIPVVSWLFLRGRCRTCNARISWRYPIVEFLIALLWGFAWWHSYQTLPQPILGIGLLAFVWTAVALAFLDAEHLWLPNALTIPATILGALWMFLEAKSVEWGSRFPPEPSASLKDLGEILLSIVIPAALIVFVRWTYWLFRRREGIGLGDAKLMAMLGAWLGLSGALLSFAVGVFLGAVFALIVIAVPGARRGSQTWLVARLPLGTFLCIGGLVSAFWGPSIIAAYLHWAGL